MTNETEAQKSTSDNFADATSGEETVNLGSRSSGSDICRVAARLPPFWPQEPAVWFAQVEGQFLLAGITTDETKFYYVLSTLEYQYAAEVKYEKLKSELIKRLSASREREVKQLLVHEELGDRKPSQFLRHLRHLAGPNMPDDFLKTIWTSRLPQNIQTVVASQPQSTLESLAELADRIQEIVPCGLQVASTSHNSPLDAMAKQISELTRQVQALTTQVNRRSRSNTRRSDQNQRGKSRTRSQSSYRRHPICWYHAKFKTRSTKCLKPCDFSANHSENDRGSR